MMYSSRVVPFLLFLTAVSARADITIGGTFTATGPTASIGAPGMNTMEIFPATIAGQKVRYVPLDDGGDPGAAVRNMRKLTQEDKVDAIIGSSSTPACLAGNDVAAETKTPQICLAPIPYRNPWVFQTPQAVPLMVAGVVEHMKESGVKTAAFVGFTDGWGDLNYNALVSLAPAAGIKVVANERYARPDTSVSAQILKILALNPDAVFVGAVGAPAALPSIALAERGYKGKVYHTHGVLNPDFLRVGGKSVEGIVAPSGPFVVADQLPDSNPIKKVGLEYAKLYEAKYGAGTRNPFGAHAWDAFLWLQGAVPVALKKGQPGSVEFRTALRDALEALKELPATHAVFTLSPTDHNGIDRRGRVMVRVENGAFKLIR
jgi:branched-chain amino acid transport system substrate-binding protein